METLKTQKITEETSDDAVIAEVFSRTLSRDVPPEASLRSVLDRLHESPVTNSPARRYDEYTAGIISHYFYAMHNTWKTVVPALLVVLLVGVAVVGMMGKKDVLEPSVNAPSSTGVGDSVSIPFNAPREGGVAMNEKASMKASPAPTGSVDDILAQLDAEADADAAIMADTDTDITLVTSDGQIISDYAADYDDTTF